MQRIIVTGATAEFYAGILELTPQQASARANCLDSLGDGLYLIRSAVQFKRGETLSFDGEMNKAQFSAVEIETSGEEEAAEAQKKAEEEAAEAQKKAEEEAAEAQKKSGGKGAGK